MTLSHLHHVDCSLEYELDGPTDFVFLIHAAQHPDQQVMAESLTLTPHLASRVVLDPQTGNRLLRLRAERGHLALRYQAEVARHPPAPGGRQGETAIDRLHDDLLPYLLPTRYCESDLLGGAAHKLFARCRAGVTRVKMISDWVHGNIERDAGASDPAATARDIFVQRTGVCRDFAHLAIAFCRAMNIPARLVVGYARADDAEPDFHAVFEAWVGDRWQLFDPTGALPVEDFIRVGTGRDATDVAYASAFGPARLTALSPQVEPDALRDIIRVGNVLRMPPAMSDTVRA